LRSTPAASTTRHSGRPSAAAVTRRDRAGASRGSSARATHMQKRPFDIHIVLRCIRVLAYRRADAAQHDVDVERLLLHVRARRMSRAKRRLEPGELQRRPKAVRCNVGGGGGSRTRVREQWNVAPTCLSLLFYLARVLPGERGTSAGQPVGFSCAAARRSAAP